jgi:hypothetical protein
MRTTRSPDDVRLVTGCVLGARPSTVDGSRWTTCGSPASKMTAPSEAGWRAARRLFLASRCINNVLGNGQVGPRRVVAWYWAARMP